MEQNLTDFHGKDVIHIQWTVCGKWEKRTVSVKKDAIKIYSLSEPYKVATNLKEKSKTGAQPYLESVIQDTPTGKATKKMCPKDKNACRSLFNCAYYLAKQEHPFSDFPDLVTLQ